MAIHLACGCGQQYAVKDELAGQQVQCFRCQRIFIVPTVPFPPLLPRAPSPGSNVPFIIASCLVLLMIGAGAAVLLNLDRLNEMLDKPEQQAEAKHDQKVEKAPSKPLPPPRTEKRQPPVQTPPPSKPKDPAKPADPKPAKPRDPPLPPPPPRPAQRPFAGHSAPILGVAFSRDAKLVLSGSGGFADEDGRFSVLSDNSLRLWDAGTGQPLKRLRGFRNGIAAVAFSPDGKLALVASAGKVSNRTWTPGGDYDLRLWDLDRERELRVLEGHRGDVLCLAFSSDGRLALSGGRDKIVRLWDVQTGQETQRLVGHTDTVNSVAFTPDGRHALSASSDQTVRLWELDRGTEVRQLAGHKDIVWAVAVSPDGRLALSAGGYQPKPGGRGLVPGNKDFAIRLWDVATGKEVRRFEGHTEAVAQVAFAPDGKRLLSCGADRSVRLWLVDSGRELRRFTGHTKLIFTVAFSADGRRALSGGADADLRVWDLPADMPELVKLLRAPGSDPTTRRKAAEELGLYGEAARAAIPELLAALSGADAELGRTILSTLEKIGKPLPAHAALLSPLVKTGIDAEVRAYALGALAALGPDARPAVPALGAVLKDRDPMLRARAVAALGLVGPKARPASYPLLVAALRDSEAIVIKAAEEALDQIGSPTRADVPALGALLKDRAEPVRRHALNALGELKDRAEPAADAVAEAAGQDQSAAVRRLALRTLLEVRPAGKESLAVFTKGLDDTDATVARQAAAALAQLGADGGALPALLRALEHADAEVVRTADAAFKKTTWNKTHARALAAGLTTVKAALRPRLLEVLTKLGGDAGDAVPALRALFKKADAREQEQLMATLGKIGPAARAAGPDLAPLLKPDPKEKNPLARLAVAFVLVDIEAEEVTQAIPVLIAGLRIINDDEESLARRERVAKALLRVGKPAAEPLALSLHGQYAIGNARTPAGLVRAAARLKVIQILAEMGPKNACTNEVLLLLTKLEGKEPFREVRLAARATRLALQKK